MCLLSLKRRVWQRLNMFVKIAIGRLPFVKSGAISNQSVA
jgi:hypothetical protein